MPKSRHLRALSAALLAACALLAAAPAPARAEVNEVRIGIQYGLIYLPVVVAGTAIWSLSPKSARVLMSGLLVISTKEFAPKAANPATF